MDSTDTVVVLAIDKQQTLLALEWETLLAMFTCHQSQL